MNDPQIMTGGAKYVA